MLSFGLLFIAIRAYKCSAKPRKQHIVAIVIFSFQV